MDLSRFLAERRPAWQELERDLERLRGPRAGRPSRARLKRTIALYRQASSDLIEARALLPDGEVRAYLDALVARAYAELYSARGFDAFAVGRFFVSDFPALVRREAAPVLLAVTVFLAGVSLGWIGVRLDPDAREWLVPAEHLELDPAERVAGAEGRGGPDPAEAAAFSSFLFTHNIRVAFLAFALGITAGIGTVAILFGNGMMLGALAADYGAAGESLFFWAWILPHGVPEIASILVAGGAGLALGRSLLFPGDLPLRESFRRTASAAVRLVAGTLPLFVLAGLVEGGFSQLHEPVLPYPVKLAAAAAEAGLLAAWLLGAGRGGAAEQALEAGRDRR